MDAALAIIEADAREFGLHDRQGAWRLGLLVARSVEPSPHGGDRRSSSFARNMNGKIRASEFAHLSGTSTKRVMKYYRAWQRAAKEGYVPRAEALEPGKEMNDLLWDRLPDWSKYYEPEQRPKVGSAPKLYPPSPPRKAEDRSENADDLFNPYCRPFPTPAKAIAKIRLDIEVVLGPRYKLSRTSLDRLEEVLLSALEEVQTYEPATEEQEVPSDMGGLQPAERQAQES